MLPGSTGRAGPTGLYRLAAALTAVIVGVMAVITGFYGMNFHYTWPPFEDAWGVPFAIGLMAVVATTMVAILRRIDWV